MVAKQSTIGVYASGINPTGATTAVARCRDAGYTGFKLKIGFGEEIDYPNIENICAQLSSTEKLMVDANQAWSLEEAIKHVGRLADYPIEWLEEPIMADSPNKDWETLAQASAIPLAAGENFADTQSFADANASSWLSVMQPDMCKWGGFSGVIPVAREALQQRKRLCPHFLGGGIGLAASAQLLAVVGGTGLLEVDSNPNPLREDLFSPYVDNGQIVLSEEPGIGVDLKALRKLQTVPVQSATPAQLSR
jgi:L-alanine-DL-glutamate epimerase-like enolase superfamily enzyme